MENFNVLFTGAGSTMGQSLIKALLMSDKYKDVVNIFVTNSEPMGAGYFLSDRVKGRYIVPIAKSPDYIDKIIEICKENNGEVCFEIVPIFEKDNLPAIYFEKRFLNIVNYLDAVIDIDMYLN